MRRGGAAVLAGLVFVLVALLSAVMTDAFMRDSHAYARTTATAAEAAELPAEHSLWSPSTVSAEVGHLFQLERNAAVEVSLLARHSRAFTYTLLAKVALLVGLGLFWIATRVRGRSVRLLNGVSRWRIQLEDLAGYGVAIVVAAIGVGAVATIIVSLRSGAPFVGFFALTYTVVAGIVGATSLLIVGAVSHLTLPSPHHLTSRRPPVTGLLRATRMSRLLAFGLVILSVGPAIAVATAAGAPPLPTVHPDDIISLSEGEQIANRYARYELWIATVAVGGLLAALIISSAVGAYLTALAGARRDFAARINGAGWWRLGAGSSRNDIVAMVMLTFCLILLVPAHLNLAHTSAAILLLGAAIGGGLMAQTAARQQIFTRVTKRSA